MFFTLTMLRTNSPAPDEQHHGQRRLRDEKSAAQTQSDERVPSRAPALSDAATSLRPA